MRGPNILHHTPLCLDPVLEFWLLPAGQEVFPPTQPPSHLRPPVTGRPGQSPHPPPPAPACPGGKQLTDSPSPEFPAGSGNLASLGEVTRVPLADPLTDRLTEPPNTSLRVPSKQAGRPALCLMPRSLSVPWGLQLCACLGPPTAWCMHVPPSTCQTPHSQASQPPLVLCPLSCACPAARGWWGGSVCFCSLVLQDGAGGCVPSVSSCGLPLFCTPPPRLSAVPTTPVPDAPGVAAGTAGGGLALTRPVSAHLCSRGG